MYLSDNYFVYSKGVEDTCFNNCNKCNAKEWKYNEELDIYEKVYRNPLVNVENNWIHNTNILEGKNSISLIWSLSPSSGQSNYVVTLSSEGGMGPSGLGYFSTGIRPLLYLSSNVKITDGTGEQNNSYKLGL